MSKRTTTPENGIIAKKLAMVRRRLLAERMATVFPWLATGVFAVAAIIVAADKYYPLGISWPVVLGAAAGAALLATLVAGALTTQSELAAAVELDRRCRLDERVSTALALRPAAETVAAGASTAELAVRQAVEADAEAAVAQIDVRASFPLAPSRRLAWPLVPVAAAIGLALGLAPAVPPTTPAATAGEQVQTQMKETAASLEKKLEEKKLEAEKLKLVEAQKLLEKLQEEARKIKAATQIDQKETLLKLNDLAQQMEARREQVSGAEAMKKQLSRLRSKNQSASEKLADALGEGKFREAAEQIERLRKELESGKLDPKQKQEMADQLERLQKQVEQLAKAQEDRRKEAEQQLASKRSEDKRSGEGDSKDGNDGDPEQGGAKQGGSKQNESKKGESKQGEKKQSGDGEQASSKSGSKSNQGEQSDLAEKLSQAAAAQQKSLDDLKNALEQAAQGMQQGKGSDASKGLGDLQRQLDDLAQQQSESDLLDKSLQDLAASKVELSRGTKGQDGGGEQSGASGKFAGKNGGGGRPGDGQPGDGSTGNGSSGNGQSGRNGQGQASADQGRGGDGQGGGSGRSNEGGTGIGTGVGSGLDGQASDQAATFDSRVKQQTGSGAFRIIGPTDGPNAKGRALEAIRDQERSLVSGREAQTLESQSLDRSRREQKKQYFDTLRKAD
jgi:hypothetical protein